MPMLRSVPAPPHSPSERRLLSSLIHKAANAGQVQVACPKSHGQSTAERDWNPGPSGFPWLPPRLWVRPFAWFCTIRD